MTVEELRRLLDEVGTRDGKVKFNLSHTELKAREWWVSPAEGNICIELEVDDGEVLDI